MTDYFTLKSLEGLLEAFLAGVVHVKQNRLKVIEGINRLDDIARFTDEKGSIDDAIGDWFADHSQWLNKQDLKENDISRIGGLLENIRGHLDQNKLSSPSRRKISSEIDRWSSMVSKTPRKVVLKRPPELKTSTEHDTIAMYANHLDDMTALFKDKVEGKKHILSILDDALKSAVDQKNKQALLLSGYIIYYLKLDGYLVEPYVKRLKQAEQLQKGDMTNA